VLRSGSAQKCSVPNFLSVITIGLIDRLVDSLHATFSTHHDVPIGETFHKTGCCYCREPNDPRTVDECGR